MTCGRFSLVILAVAVLAIWLVRSRSPPGMIEASCNSSRTESECMRTYACAWGSFRSAPSTYSCQPATCVDPEHYEPVVNRHRCNSLWFNIDCDPLGAEFVVKSWSDSGSVLFVRGSDCIGQDIQGVTIMFVILCSMCGCGVWMLYRICDAARKFIDL